MEMYHAFVEVDDRTPITPDDVDELLDKLETYHGAMSVSPRGFRALDLSLPAESMVQAAQTTAMIASAYLRKDAIACQVMTEKEFTAREEWLGDMPELASVTQVAEDLGVSRAAILDRIRRGTLQAIKVGDTYAIPRPRT
jgi:excisionase family DNA binding protein